MNQYCIKLRAMHGSLKVKWEIMFGQHKIEFIGLRVEILNTNGVLCELGGLGTSIRYYRYANGQLFKPRFKLSIRITTAVLSFLV